MRRLSSSITAAGGSLPLLGNPQDVLDLETEYANFWAALTWLTHIKDAGMMLRLCAALGATRARLCRGRTRD